MDNPFNNYVLHRAAEVFTDVSMPPKIQEAFDLWKKVRKHVVIGNDNMVGGQHYILRLTPPKIGGAKLPVCLRLLAKGKIYHDGYNLGMEFKILENSEGGEVGKTVFFPLAIISGRLFRSTAATQRFLNITTEMHPAQFFCMVTGVPYIQETFDQFREYHL